MSVIIPVYNAEKYLANCLDSVLDQPCLIHEVLCVDDGSCDSSAAIVRAYAKKDGRVKLLQQANAGAGVARNHGIEAATGEYVLFLDADDWLLPDSLAHLLAQAGDADVIRCRALDYNQQTGKMSRSRSNGLWWIPPFLFGRTLTYRRVYPLFSKVNVAPWGGLVRRQFLMDKGIRFNDLVCVNDRSFYWACILQARSIRFLPQELVCYRTNVSTSLVGNRMKHFDCQFQSYELVYEMSRMLPAAMRRRLLSGELLDLAYWLRICKNTEWGPAAEQATAAFLLQLDTTPWNGRIRNTRWHRELNKMVGYWRNEGENNDEEKD